MNSSNPLISNAIGSTIAGKFGLDMTQTFMLSGVISSLIQDGDFLNTNRLLVLAFVAMTYYAYGYLKKFNWFKSTHSVVRFYDFNKSIAEWVKKNENELFKDRMVMTIGKENSHIKPKEITYDITTSKFLIEIDGKMIKGYAAIKGYEKEIAAGDKIIREKWKYFEIGFRGYPVGDFLKYLDRLQEEKGTYELKMNKIHSSLSPTSSSGEKGSTFMGVKKVKGKYPKNEMYEKYIKSYFSPVRDRIWREVELIENHCDDYERLGQIPYINLLLHGPPGSGKSTLAYRLALATNRNIVSLDITTIYNKEKLFKIYDNTVRRGDILLLEEFDRTVDYLIKKQSKDVKDMADIKDEKTALKMYREQSSDEIRLGDLLEFFQGAIPAHQGIVIATTNHYEHMRDIIPELFRPGRLTPVYVGYLDWQTLQELTEFYFGERLEYDKIDDIMVPTSKIINLALQHSLRNDFEGYRKELMRVLISTQSSSLGKK